MPRITRSKRSRPEDLTNPDPKTQKRARMTEPNVALSALVKHPDLWLSDGNIVLAAGDVCFKIHRSQLARFCAVFDDMFGAPGPAGVGDDVMEDCVVIRMPDDPEDLTHFLEAIYNGHSFDFRTEYAQNFPAVAGVLRLATKYDCAALRTRLVTALRKQYPNWLQPFSFWPQKYEGPTPHVNVLHLARECDIPEILPTCFYRLAFSSSGDEPVAILSSNDKKRLKDGKAGILRHVRQFLKRGPPAISVNCYHGAEPSPRRRTNRLVPNNCAQFLVEYWAKDVYPGKKLPQQLTADPLRGISILMYPNTKAKQQGSKAPLCQSCNGMFSEHMKIEQRAIWDNVSEYFMLSKVA